MKDIPEYIFKSLSEGNILLLVTIVIVALLFNVKKIIDFYEERKKLKINNISEALGCKHITDISKTFLEEELATEYFNRSTGIGVHRKFREAILDTYGKNQNKIKFAHYVRALNHLVFDEENLSISVKITLFEKIGFWVNFCGGMLFSFVGILFVFIPIQMKTIQILDILKFFGMGGFFVLFSLFILYQSTSVISAKIILKECNYSA